MSSANIFFLKYTPLFNYAVILSDIPIALEKKDNSGLNLSHVIRSRTLIDLKSWLKNS